jgi:hypothetical protein
MTSTKDTSVRIIKSGSCPSVSGKSKVGYQVGCDDAGNLAVRIATNSGGGFFSDEWVPLTTIEKILQSSATKKSLTSTTLRPIFRGRSVNTAGFLLAVLKHERAIRLQEGKTRLYEAADLDAFVQALQSHTLPVSSKTAGEKGKAGSAAKKPKKQAPSRGG